LAAFIFQFEDPIAFFLALKGLQVLPKRFILLHHLLIRNRKLEAEEKVGKRVPRKNIVTIKDLTLFFEVDPEIVCPESVKDVGTPMEFPDFASGIIQLFFGKVTDPVDQPKLSEDVEFVQLAHALFAEIQLKHMPFARDFRFVARD